MSVSACLRASSTCLDKCIKRKKWESGGGVVSGGGGWGGRQSKEKSNWCAGGWVEFLNDLIPVSAESLTVGIPVSPGDNGNSLRLISPPQSHLSTSPPSVPPPPTSLPSSLLLCIMASEGDSQQKVHLNMMAGVYSQRNSTTL